MSTSIYVGPARVLSIAADGRPRLQVLGGACDTTVADWAIPYRYEAHAGDLLLVLGRDRRYWVTGVIHGRGRSQLAFRGDTSLAASGTMHLSGDGGVQLDSPEVRIETDTLDSEAQHLIQRTDDFESVVYNTSNERAGECTRIIEENDQHTAFRQSTVAKHIVKIDASLLRLS